MKQGFFSLNKMLRSPAAFITGSILEGACAQQFWPGGLLSSVSVNAVSYFISSGNTYFKSGCVRDDSNIRGVRNSEGGSTFSWWHFYTSASWASKPGDGDFEKGPWWLRVSLMMGAALPPSLPLASGLNPDLWEVPPLSQLPLGSCLRTWTL